MRDKAVVGAGDSDNQLVTHAADCPPRETRTGREVAISAVYTTLERLETKGYVRSRLGEPTPERGGRRKRHFAMLPAGERALKSAYDTFRGMTAGLEQRLKAL